MSEPTMADITTRVNAVGDTSAVLTSYYRSDVLALLACVRELRAALEEAIEGYEYACEYKGDYLVRKHGDRETLAGCRAVLAHYPEEPSRA